MMLDIEAYENVTELKDALIDDNGEVMNYPADWCHVAEVNEGFPYHAGTIKDNAVYTKGDNAKCFSVGRYSFYGCFREALAELAGYEPIMEEPDEECPYSLGAWHAEQGVFKELIDFSDCEGVIGAAYSKKLSEDFAQIGDQYIAFFKAKGVNGERYVFVYEGFREAFQLAANNGFVSFE